MPTIVLTDDGLSRRAGRVLWARVAVDLEPEIADHAGEPRVMGVAVGERRELGDKIGESLRLGSKLHARHLRGIADVIRAGGAGRCRS
jgi:hypothetical protein